MAIDAPWQQRPDTGPLAPETDWICWIDNLENQLALMMRSGIQKPQDDVQCLFWPRGRNYTVPSDLLKAKAIAREWSPGTFVVEARPWASLMFAGCPVEALKLVAAHQDLEWDWIATPNRQAVCDAANEIAEWLKSNLGLDIKKILGQRTWRPSLAH